MLKHLRKKGVSKKILWVVAFVIVISFSFFGTASYLNRGALSHNYAGILFGQKIPLKDCKALTWQLCLSGSKSCYSPVVQKKEMGCITQDINLRSIYRIGSTLWFVAQLKMVPFQDLDSYMIDLIGVPLSSR